VSPLSGSGHRVSAARVWLIDHLPAGVLERPAEWFLALLSIISGAGGLFGPVEQASLDALLPAFLHRGWNLALVVGGIALISGLSSIRYIPDRRGYAITRLPGYRLGCRLLGIASYVYAGGLLWTARFDGFFPAMVVLVFGLVFTVRLLTLRGRDAA
jgi:hypothetical protein